MRRLNGFLISAPQSGSGKTTVSLAIMAALVRRGFAVCPFKCGPDFIDPGYHRLATGNASVNLDGWICGEEFVRRTFKASLATMTGRKVAVIEGAMGLFDGIGASGRDGSSAQIASITGAPVVLVVDARGMAGSAAALVKGFARFDPEVRVAGVIFNNVGSRSHAEILRIAMAEALPDITVFGSVPRDETLVIDSRHLGLVTAEEDRLSNDFMDRLAEMAERFLDVDRLAALEVNPPQTALVKNGNDFTLPPAVEGGVRIAVARDKAFCFMYEDNLRLLQNAGAEIAFFSPIRDRELPADINGIYLPGGYPELYAKELGANMKMKEAIRGVVAEDMPVYAECGGFVYLTQGVDASENQVESDLVGIFPVRSRMLPRRKALGYRQVELATGSIIGREGALCRGHEFHYSETGEMPDCIARCYRVSRQGIELGAEGFRVRNCLGSYIHLHFGSNPEIAPAFVDSCRRYKQPQP